MKHIGIYLTKTHKILVLKTTKHATEMKQSKWRDTPCHGLEGSIKIQFSPN
jgi:hypothetical protein